MTADTQKPYPLGEEIANAVTHGLGTAAAIVATTLLLVKGSGSLSGWQLAGIAVYGGSMITLFLASTLYHAIHHEASKAVLKRIDHIAIYLLIAGSYTPFMSITLQSASAHALLTVVWGLALIGLVFKIYFIHRFPRVSLITYLVMGWLAMFMVYELWQVLPRPGFWLLIAGGLCYTVGAAFYAMKNMRYSHAIWHLWVIAGAVCHCVSIGLYVIPPVA